MIRDYKIFKVVLGVALVIQVCKKTGEVPENCTPVNVDQPSLSACQEAARDYQKRGTMFVYCEHDDGTSIGFDAWIQGEKK